MDKWLDSQDQVIRIILFIPIWGWIISLLYRIFKYVNGSKNALTLIVGILCVVTPIGFVVSLIDLITTITANKVTFCAE